MSVANKSAQVLYFYYM